MGVVSAGVTFKAVRPDGVSWEGERRKRRRKALWPERSRTCGNRKRDKEGVSTDMGRIRSVREPRFQQEGGAGCVQGCCEVRPSKD